MSVTKKNDFRVMTKKFGTLTRRADKSISSRLTLTEVVAILGNYLFEYGCFTDGCVLET